MPLTELAFRNAKPRDRLFKLSDGGGLQLWVTPDGAKRWRLAYRYAGKQKLLALGVYPLVGAKQARLARDDAKRLLAAGKDPSLERKAARAADVAAAHRLSEQLLQVRPRRRGPQPPDAGSHDVPGQAARAARGDRGARPRAGDVSHGAPRRARRGRHQVAGTLRSSCPA